MMTVCFPDVPEVRRAISEAVEQLTTSLMTLFPVPVEFANCGGVSGLVANAAGCV
jgi:hypothetical protein